MNEKMKEIQEKMNKIDLAIESKKEEIKVLRLKKYFLNQMVGKIERLDKDYNKLFDNKIDIEKMIDFKNEAEKNEK